MYNCRCSRVLQLSILTERTTFVESALWLRLENQWHCVKFKDFKLYTAKMIKYLCSISLTDLRVYVVNLLHFNLNFLIIVSGLFTQQFAFQEISHKDCGWVPCCAVWILAALSGELRRDCDRFKTELRKLKRKVVWSSAWLRNAEVTAVLRACSPPFLGRQVGKPRLIRQLICGLQKCRFYAAIGIWSDTNSLWCLFSTSSEFRCEVVATFKRSKDRVYLVMIGSAVELELGG